MLKSKISSLRLRNVIDDWGDALFQENVVSIHSFVGLQKKITPLCTENTRPTESTKFIRSPQWTIGAIHKPNMKYHVNDHNQIIIEMYESKNTA